jgi:putative nucleotidyltransferase with HDIG domain
MVAIATCAVILAINLMGDVSGAAARDRMIREAGHGLLNGLLVGAVVLLALQPLEWLFGVVTDVQLLEFSDLNHPLLRRMVLEASGSHEHSQIVGRIAQEAAEAIGANGLLARVGSYYHDIGKMAKQEYFSENQRDHNVHDGLSPAMSARIVAGHVKEGIKLAEEYKLPQPIRDIIAQHHGTSLIGFFYQNAVREKEEKEGAIREEDFRYPGPKPQTREAATVMLADAIESASRSLANPTLTRLQGLAERIVNSKFTDGQFDECDLTLKDLHVLAEVITRTIASASHVRLEYPEEKKKRSDRITYAGVSEPLKQNSHEDEEPRESEATMSQPS